MPRSWWPVASATSTASAACAIPAWPASSSERPSSPGPSTTPQPWRPPHDPRRPTAAPARARAVLALGVGAASGRVLDRRRRRRRVPHAAGASGAAAAACPTSQPEPLPAGETRTVTIETDKGNIVIKIEADLSPIAAGNFVALAACGFYDGVVFHRRRCPELRHPGRRPDGHRRPAAPATRSRTSRSRRPTARAPWRWPGPPSRTRSARSSSSSSTTRPGGAGVGQHLPDHRDRDVRDGGRRRDRRGRRRPSSPAEPGRHDQVDRQPTPDRTAASPQPRSQPMTSATIATELGDIEIDLFDESAPKAAGNFIDLATQGLLRRRRLPPRHPGLRRPGRRRPVRQEVVARARPGRDRRSRLQVRGRAGQGRLRPRRARDGQRRAEHQRQPVLHLPPGPDRQAAEELHAVRPGDARAWTSSTRSSARRATAATCPHDPVAMTLGDRSTRHEG